LFYGLPVEDLQTFRQRVNAVTVDDIQRVAQKYLRPDRLSIVLVGNASAFASQLRGIGFGAFETIELADLDLTAANFKRAARRAAIGGRGALRAEQARPLPLHYQQVSAVNAQEGAKAMALVDQAIAAKG